MLDVCNSQEFASLPPSQIVPRLADQGRYLASESSFYRILRAADQQHRRGRSQPPRHVPVPTSHTATGPNQVWSWDITYLPSLVRGQYYYLYLIEDIYSRKGVGWEVHEWLITSCRSANNIMPITIFLPAGTASFFYSA